MRLILLCLSLLLVLAAPARPEGVVLDCTQEDLEAAIAGGGLVLFEDDCSISLSNAVAISEDTTIDASGFDVTLSGEGLTRLITVLPGASLTILGVTLREGAVTNVGGAAIFVGAGAEVTVSNCVFLLNSATGQDGADGKDGHASIGTGTDGEPGIHGGSVSGGAIYNTGSFAAYRCRFLTNTVFGGHGGNGGNGGLGTFQGGNGGRGGNGGSALGGAIYSTDTILVSECTFAGNGCGAGNGGIGGDGGGGAFAGFPADGGTGGAGSGGTIYNSGPSTQILSSTFEANGAQGGKSQDAGMEANRMGGEGPDGGDSLGGAVYADGSLTISNSTFYANDAIGGNGGNGGPGEFTGGDGGNGGDAEGGGVTGKGDKAVVNCTFLENSATGGTNGLAGAGPFRGEIGKRGRSRGGHVANPAGSFLLANTILATNSLAGKVGYGTFVDGGHNLSADTSIALGDTSRVDQKNLRLGPLGNYGGPTRTISLLTNSPAIDAALDDAAPDTDQRGLPRPVGLRSDIGAFEYSFTLSGKVRVGTSGLPGVTITINDEWSAQTDNAGNYSIPVPNGPVEIIPELEGYRFSPETISLVVTGNTSGVNFTAAQQFTLRGRILESSNAVPSVTVLVGTNSLTTSSNGLFQIALPAGTYTVTPTNTCYRFDPTNRIVTLNATNTNRADFAAFRESLSGRVTLGTNGIPLPNVLIQVGQVSTVTDTNGDYAVSNLCRGPYLVVPALAGYAFSPSQLEVILPGTNKANFIANQGFAASGSVLEGTQPLGEVKLQLTGGTTNSQLTTNGAFAFTGLSSGTPYLIVPTAPGYRFAPPTWAFTLTGDTNTTFQALPLPGLTAGTNGVTLSFLANTGRVYQLETSTNLLNWQILTTNTTPFLFQDTNTSDPARFYRMR